jgi:hypothetical protein
VAIVTSSLTLSVVIALENEGKNLVYAVIGAKYCTGISTQFYGGLFTSTEFYEHRGPIYTRFSDLFCESEKNRAAATGERKSDFQGFSSPTQD